MTAGIESSLTSAPSARAWMGRVAHALAARESAFVVFPATVAPEPVLDAITRLAEGLGCSIGEVDLARVDPVYPPLTGVMTALGIDPALATSVDALTRLQGAPDVILIGKLDSLRAEAINRWTVFVQHLARATTNQPGHGPAILCAFPSSAVLSGPPSAAPHLQLHWWHGIPSATEIRLACREAPAESTDAARQIWREHLLPSVAGNDVVLAATVWEAIFESRQAIEGLLRDYASKRGWTPERLLEAGAGTFVGSPIWSHNREPPRERGLWAMGALMQTPEFGLELHSAALAVLLPESAWQQRIWRGQLAAALPLLEEIRLRLSQRMTDAWGSDWPSRWMEPDTEEERREVQASPLAASWGFLSHLHRNVPILARDTKLAGFIKRAQHMRNELSHSRPVVFPDFKILYERAAEIIWSD